MLADSFAISPISRSAATCRVLDIAPRARSTRFSLLVLLLSLVLAKSAHSSEYLGILGEIIRPESSIGSQLNLTEEQQSQLKQLVSRRSSAAVGLAATLKDAPKSEHAGLMAAFAAESERLAYELLNPEQAIRLARLRLQWLGLVSLDEDEIAQQLNLADWQRDIVALWREKVRVARRANEEEEMRPQAESAIRRELSESQFQAWQVLAGVLEQSTLGPPQPPVRETAPAAEVQRPSEVDATSATAENTDSPQSEKPLEELQLELNFQKQPWNDVIRWLADQAELSVHSELVPPGSFTYRDRSRTYSVSETLDIMNASLLDSGYALYRQGRFLRCINFESDQEKRAELLKELTDTITEAELPSRGRYEPVRVLFNLERLDPDEVIEEVQDLLSIQGSAISLVSSGQLLVTDMAGNVRNVAEFIRRSEDPTSARGATVQTLPLKSINAEEVLIVARPLLELEPDINVSESIKISTNTFGTIIYARGDIDKIQILRDLVTQMDHPPEGAESPIAFETPSVERHLVRGLDLELAYQVASQLLAGSPDVRLAKDETANQLVLQGRKADHQLLKETLNNLAGEASDFKVISLQNLDTVSAVAAVKKFFNLPDKPDAESTGPVIDGDASARQIWVKGSATQIQQIEDLIGKLEATAKSSRSMWGDRLRVIPMNGSGTADALRQAEMLWQQVYGSQNPIVNQTGLGSSSGLKTKTLAPERPLRPASERNSPDDPIQSSQQSRTATLQKAADGFSAPEATSGGEPIDDSKDGVEDLGSGVVPNDAAGVDEVEKKDAQTRSHIRRPKNTVVGDVRTIPTGRLVNAWQDEFSSGEEGVGSQEHDLESQAAPDSDPPSQGEPIVIQEGPNGIMISSNDPEALERFDNLLRMILDQSTLGEMEPEVIYLQNIKAVVAKQLLTEILSGVGASGSSGGLIGDMASGILGGLGGGMLGSLLGGGSAGAGSPGSAASGSGMAISEYSIVADPRLNVLFVKASPPDMKLIEQILKIIDQVEGPFNVDVQGVMDLIPVVTQDVNDVLATVRSIFGDRVEGGGGGAPQPAGGQNNPAEFFQAMRSAFGGRGNQGQQSAQRTDMSEPKMSIGADSFSNTLIVMGQPYQIAEVRRLVEMLDQAGESEQEEVVVVEMGAISSPALNSSLQRMLGPRAMTSTSTTSSGSSTSGSTSSSTSSRGQTGQGGQTDADTARRRAEFFQRMMQGQGGNSGSGGNQGNRGTRGNSNQSSGGNRRR